jgi:hypothetical protein
LCDPRLGADKSEATPGNGAITEGK